MAPHSAIVQPKISGHHGVVGLPRHSRSNESHIVRHSAPFLTRLARLARRHWPLFAIAIAGCDLTGQYDKKFQETLQTSGQRAVFDQHLHAAPTEVTNAARENVGVKLRIPKVFDSNSKAVAAKGDAPLPGLSYSLIRDLDDANGKSLPVVVMFAATAKADQKTEAMQGAVAQYVAGKVPGAKWEDVEVATPSGTKLPLKRIRADSPQSFGAEHKKTGVLVDGRFELYYVEGPSHNVIIGWLFPKPQAEKHQLEQVIEAAMGTVETTAAPPSEPGGQPAPGKAAPTGCM